MTEDGFGQPAHPALAGLAAALIVAGGEASGKPLGDLSVHLARPPAEIAVFPGRARLIDACIGALREGRRELLVQNPVEPRYRLSARRYDLTIRRWAPRPGPLRYDVSDAIRGLVNKAPALCVISDPHWILGNCLDTDAVLSLAVAARHGGHLLLIDRACALEPGDETDLLLRDDESVVVLGSLSRSLFVPGPSLDYAVGAPGLVDRLNRWRPAVPSTAADPSAAETVLRDHLATVVAVRRDLIEGRDWLAAQVVRPDLRWRALPSRACFLTVDVGDPALAARLTANLAGDGPPVRGHPTRVAVASLLQVTAAPVAASARLLALLRAQGSTSGERQPR
ncbi:MAG: aminotransferase class I/II-fold pyridoxal phosphate-dependent enzyme [Frankia sp.]